MPEAETQPFGFGPLEVFIEDDGLGPGDEVLGQEDKGQPSGVGGEVGEGELPEPGVFGGGDELLGAFCLGGRGF